MTQIMVYPTTRNSLVMRHPVNGPLTIGGSLWDEDGVTARALMEGAITTDKAAGFRDASIATDVSKPPPHATGVPVDNPPETKVTKR